MFSVHAFACSWCLNNIHTFHGVMQSKGDLKNTKVNRVKAASQGSISHRYGSFYIVFSFSYPLTAFFKFSPYNRALYTIKPSFTPPPRQLPVSDLETQVICHQRGELEETASPAWVLQAGPDSSPRCSAECSQAGEYGWRSGVAQRVGASPQGCAWGGRICVFVYTWARLFVHNLGKIKQTGLRIESFLPTLYIYNLDTEMLYPTHI